MNCSSHEAAEVASLLPQTAALGGVVGGKRGKEEQAWIDEGRKETLSMYSGIKNFHLCRFGDFLLTFGDFSFFKWFCVAITIYC